MKGERESPTQKRASEWARGVNEESPIFFVPPSTYTEIVSTEERDGK